MCYLFLHELLHSDHVEPLVTLQQIHVKEVLKAHLVVRHFVRLIFMLLTKQVQMLLGRNHQRPAYANMTKARMMMMTTMMMMMMIMMMIMMMMNKTTITNIKITTIIITITISNNIVIDVYSCKDISLV